MAVCEINVKVNRVTPDDVVGAFQATGLWPVRHTWYRHQNTGNCSCGLGALLMRVYDERGIPRPDPIRDYRFNYETEVCEKLGLHPLYVLGFTRGWDGVGDPLVIGETRHVVDETEKLIALVGYMDGHEAYNTAYEVIVRKWN